MNPGLPGSSDSEQGEYFFSSFRKVLQRLPGNHPAGDICKEEFIYLYVGMLGGLKYGFYCILRRHCCIRVLGVVVCSTRPLTGRSAEAP